MASYPWIRPERQQQDMANFPHVERWRHAIAARPAVQRAYAIAKSVNPQPAPMDDKARQVLFGQDRSVVR
jgi:GST-like protein